MLGLTEINSSRVAVLEVSGKLAEEDCNSVLPELEAALDKPEPLRFYIELHNFSGIDIAAIQKE